MSTFKKVMCVVLCVAMLAGTFAMLGLQLPKASAVSADVSALAGETHVKTLKNLTDPVSDGGCGYSKFLYLASDIMEINPNNNTKYISDGYVNAGDTISVRVYLKSDLYCAPPAIHTIFDETVFTSKGTNGAAAGAFPDATPFTDGLNDDFDLKTDRGMTAAITGSAADTWFAGTYKRPIKQAGCAIPIAECSAWELILVTTEFDVVPVPKYYEANPTAFPGFETARLPELTDLWDTDDYFFEFDLKVLDDVATDTSGFIGTDARVWKSYDYNATDPSASTSKRPAFINADIVPQYYSDTGKITMAKINNFFFDDYNHTIIVGENPDAGEASTDRKLTFDTSKIVDKIPTITDIPSLENIIYAEGDEIDVPEFTGLDDLIVGWRLISGTLEKADGTFYGPAEFVDIDSCKISSTDVVIEPILANINDSFDITFNAGGGGAKFSDETVTKKIPAKVISDEDSTYAQVAVPEDPTREGYQFSGWADASSVALPEAGIFTTFRARTYNAQWIPATYTVNLFETGTSAEPYYSQTFNYNTVMSVTSANIRTKTGFAIAQWLTIEDDTVIAATSDSTSIKFGRAIGQTYTFNIYPEWTSRSRIVFMGKNYASTGEDDKWIELTSMSGIPGNLLTDSDDSKPIESLYNSVNANPSLLNSAYSFKSSGFDPSWYSSPDFAEDSRICRALKDKRYLLDENGNTVYEKDETGKLVPVFGPTIFPAIEYPSVMATKIVYLKTVQSVEDAKWYIPKYDAKTATYSYNTESIDDNLLYEITDEKSFYEGYTAMITNPSFERVAANNSATKLTDVDKKAVLEKGWICIGWSTTPDGKNPVTNYKVNGAAGISTSTFSLTGGKNEYYAIIVPEYLTVSLRVSGNVLLSVTGKSRGGTLAVADIPVLTLSDGTKAPALKPGTDGSRYGMAGHTFVGWSLTAGGEIIDMPISLTGENVAKASYPSGIFTLASPKNILFYGVWEATTLSTTFVYHDENDEEKTVSFTAPYGTNYKAIISTNIPDALAKVPYGHSLATEWTYTPGAVDENGVLLDGGTYTAVYLPAIIHVTYLYDDVENTQNKKVVDRKFGEEATDLFTQESTGFKGTEKWPNGYILNEWVLVSGELAEDNTFKEDLVYKVTYTPRKEFLLRVYDSNGYKPSKSTGLYSDSNLYLTIDRSFKMQYWNKGVKVEKDAVDKDGNPIANINPNDQVTVMLFLSFSLENFDWDMIYDINMWKEVSLYAEPFTLPRSMFTKEGIQGLLSAIGNLIFKKDDETTTAPPITNPPASSTTAAQATTAAPVK